MKAKDKAVQFAAWLLRHAPSLEVAAATYDARGKVQSIAQGRLPIRCIDDFARAYGWLAAKNARPWPDGCNIWIRPHSSLCPEHQLLMLDDVRTSTALAVARKYRSAVVETRTGNCQCWLVCNQPLPRDQRQDVLRHLIHRVGADPGALAEPRWGRLPGFSGRKPQDLRVWVNTLVLPCAGEEPPLFAPQPYLSVSPPPPAGGRVLSSKSIGRSGAGADRSRQHFGYACAALRAGVGPDLVVQRVAQRAYADGKRRTSGAAYDYAQALVNAAMRVVAVA